jgi:glycerol-3-phosphate O-acyltransferase/dihydroxyacetone phosphate acyltransferase
MLVTGKENIPKSGPLIIVCNHPNTFMDPLIAAVLTPQKVGFIANAGIFSNPLFASILRYFHVIPVYRKKDIKPGETPDNAAAFIKCHEYLDRKGTLLIFPEGNSHYELKLREIKTGTARIALSYEKLTDFESGLSIVPISLDYSDSLQFRSMISITINPPIRTSTYKEVYLFDEFTGVNNLTQDIGKVLAQNTPQTSDKEHERLLIRTHKFYSTFIDSSANLYRNPSESLRLRNSLADDLHQLRSTKSELYEDIALRLDKFYRKIAELSLTAGFFTEAFTKKSNALVYSGYLFTLILLSPIYLFGLVTNYIPYILPSKVFELLKLDIEYKTSVGLIVGLITFPFFYAFEIFIFQYFFDTSALIISLFSILLPLSGYLTMYYWVQLNRFARVIRFHHFLAQESKNEIVNSRDELLKIVQILR